MAKRSRGDSSPSTPGINTPQTQSDSPAPVSESVHSTKYTHLDREALKLQGQQVMRCSLPAHKETCSFDSYEEYEVHYAKSHVNRCTECGKNFPTEHFLGLHIEENHDPLMQARREKGERTYGCFVEGCDRKCSAPHKRRRHLIDKHMFPRSYNFYIVNDGIDKKSSMLTSNRSNRRRVSTAQSPQHEGRLRRRAFSQLSASGFEPSHKEPKVEEQAEDEEEDSDDTDDSSDSETVKFPGKGEPKEMAVRTKSTITPAGGGQPQLRPPHPKPSNDAVENLSKSLSALKFVPTSVTLNRKGKK